jgi:predicted Zn-dependent protease
MIKAYVYKSTTIILGVTFLISVSCSNKPQVEGLNYNRISSLARSFSYNQILTEFNTYPWDREKDPSILMIYCEALVEGGKELPYSLKSPPLPAYMSEFAQGYYDLLNGKPQESINRFLNLINTGDIKGQVWGNIGFLEFVLYTEGIAHMKIPLERLEFIADRYPSSVPSWVIPYYSAWYYFNSGKFPEVERILQEYGKYLEPDTIVDLKVQLLIRENRFKEAKEVIKNLPPELLNDQDIIELESYIIRLESGVEQEKKYLDEKHNQFPYLWLVEQRYAETLIKSGQIELGIDILKKLAQKRTFDVIIQLYIAEDLLDYGEVDNAKKIFSHILNKSPELPYYSAYYNFLLAKIYHAQKKEEEAQKSLSLAIKLYPNAPRFLWLMFDIALEKHDYVNANQIIKEILELYPNEVSALVELMKLSYLRREWDELSAAEKAISLSKRYISEETWDEIRSYKALSLATQGKFDDAYKVAADIKNASMHTKTNVEINKLRKNKKRT